MTTMQMTKKYTTFVFLILSFIIPVTISGFLYYNHKHSSLKKTNPPGAVQYLWQNNNSKQWQIVQVSKETCDSDCENIVYTLNQVKNALGKNSERVNVQQVVLSESALQHIGKNEFPIENKIYLVDPTGKLLMYYSDASNPMIILKDLNRALEGSQVG